MYSVLIVDDERFMREGISRTLPWESLGVDHVDTAESGAKALLKMKEHMPDVVITDIEMKNMNGLEYIRAVNALNPEVRIIVLTAHDNFAYVQQCCRMEVKDYLLKPIDPAQLVASVKKQLEELEQSREEEKHRLAERRAVGYAEYMELRQLLRDFFENNRHETELADSLAELGYRCDAGAQAVLITPDNPDPEEWKKRRELQDLSINSTCMELIDRHGMGITFRDERNSLILLLFVSEKNPDCLETAEEVRTVLLSEYGAAGRIFMGDPAHTMQELRQSYRQATRLWENTQVTSGVVRLHAETDWAADAFRAASAAHREMIGHVGNTELVLRDYESFREQLEKLGIPDPERRSSNIHLLSAFYLDWIRQTGGSVGPVLGDMIAKMNEAEGEAIADTGRAFLEGLFAESLPAENDAVKAAMRYISSHLEEDLSVTRLAEQYYLSVAYFSRLFKKTAGVGCNYYIMQQRMEKAKQLLSSGKLRIADAAEQLGYKDVNYFSLTFKKYTGLSPADYREQNGRKKS